MFTAPDDISKMTIGPPHRSSLGIGGEEALIRRCREPEILSVMPVGSKTNRGIKDHS